MKRFTFTLIVILCSIIFASAHTCIPGDTLTNNITNLKTLPRQLAKHLIEDFVLNPRYAQQGAPLDNTVIVWQADNESPNDPMYQTRSLLKYFYSSKEIEPLYKNDFTVNYTNYALMCVKYLLKAAQKDLRPGILNMLKAAFFEDSRIADESNLYTSSPDSLLYVMVFGGKIKDAPKNWGIRNFSERYPLKASGILSMGNDTVTMVVLNTKIQNYSIVNKNFTEMTGYLEQAHAKGYATFSPVKYMCKHEGVAESPSWDFTQNNINMVQTVKLAGKAPLAANDTAKGVSVSIHMEPIKFELDMSKELGDIKPLGIKDGSLVISDEDFKKLKASGARTLTKEEEAEHLANHRRATLKLADSTYVGPWVTMGSYYEITNPKKAKAMFEQLSSAADDLFCDSETYKMKKSDNQILLLSKEYKHYCSIKLNENGSLSYLSVEPVGNTELHLPKGDLNKNHFSFKGQLYKDVPKAALKIMDEYQATKEKTRITEIENEYFGH